MNLTLIYIFFLCLFQMWQVQAVVFPIYGAVEYSCQKFRANASSSWSTTNTFFILLCMYSIRQPSSPLSVYFSAPKPGLLSLGISDNIVSFTIKPLSYSRWLMMICVCVCVCVCSPPPLTIVRIDCTTPFETKIYILTGINNSVRHRTKHLLWVRFQIISHS